MKKNVILIVLLAFWGNLILWSQTLIYNKEIPVEKIKLIPEMTLGGVVSERLSDIEYIVLKGEKSTLLDDIYEMDCSDKRIAIINTKGICYLYDINGNLLRIIDKVIGAEKREGIFLFYKVKFNGKGFNLLHGPFSANYDLNGNFIDTVQNTTKYDYTTTLGEKKISYFSPNLKDKKELSQDVLKLNDSVIVRYEKAGSKMMSYGLRKPFSTNSRDKVFATFDYSTKLFGVDSTGIYKIYQFIFPLRNTLKIDEIVKIKDDTEYMYYYSSNSDVVFGLDNIITYKDYILFTLNRYNKLWLAFNVETKEIYGLSNILPDQNNDFLDFMDNKLVITDGEYLYSFLSTQAIQFAIDKSIQSHHTLSAKLEQMKKSNNPVIVKFKLK